MSRADEAGENHRDINRHKYSREKIAQTVKKPMLQKVTEYKFRNLTLLLTGYKC
jgi:hypothetical protein